MKKGTIIALIVASVLILAGGTILTLGLSFADSLGQSDVTTVTQSTHTIPESFDSILIDTEDCNVDFVLLEGVSDPYVVIQERERTNHSILVENGTLKIQMTDNRSWRDFIGVNWEQMSITLYLPQVQYASVRVTTATGHIQIQEAFQIQEARLHSDTGKIVCSAEVTDNLGCFTATGSITVQGTTAGITTLDSNTGRIHVSNATGTEFHLENDTGRTELENISCALLTSESETGDVTLRNVLVEEHLQVSTDTGDVLIENSDTGSANIETDTGDVTGHFLSPKYFVTETDTGNIVVPQSREGGECLVTTDTGDITFY